MYSRILFFVSSLLVHYSATADVSHYLNSIQDDPRALYQFFEKMPKGGELHYHLSGGAKPEVMLDLASTHHYCLDRSTSTLTDMTPACTGIDSFGLKEKPELYQATLRAWSMKNFIPGSETAHDHFFNTFFKFNPIVVHHSPDLLIDVLTRAAKQHEHYLEIMILPDNNHASQFDALIRNTSYFKQKKAILLSNPAFIKNIDVTKKETHALLTKTKTLLKCNQKKAKHPACALTLRFQYIILREQQVNQFFAQALNAFAAANHSEEIAGINLVQAEDGPLSLKNYKIQMQIIQFLHRAYPQVSIALHAGELGQDLLDTHKITSEDMQFHINDAVMIGHANRIGHGIDLRQEKNHEVLTKYMAKHHIPVEVSLTSNQTILNLSKKHPIKYYLHHQIPVVISTDDEGLLRTNLTKQYVVAANIHHLDYQTLKTINRNTLTYSFLPGESIWKDPIEGLRTAECAALKSVECHKFIHDSRKAKLQWQLEQALNTFEASYNKFSSPPLISVIPSCHIGIKSKKLSSAKKIKYRIAFSMEIEKS